MATRSMFRNSVLLSGLISQEQLDRAIATIATAGDGPPAPLVDVDSDTIAAKLVELGMLTPYQADQIKAGRTKFNLGPYTVTDFIGQGGMGQVYKGVHQVMGRECAIKVLPMSKATPEAIANFTREIRTQAQLDHPNLVRAYDAGRDGSVHYLVVEFVPGVDLRKLIRSQGHPLTQQQAASVVLQAARGLDHAHKRGLIHRDIKPGNILVTSEGIAKVSDLGLAGFMQDAANDPRAGKVVGTADYLAPEQIRTPNEVTFLADIYSLGCTLYYAVCGKVPFPGGNARQKALRHLEETPWHPRRFNPDLSEEFIEVIADMMEKDPKSRIQSAADVAARLEQWAGEASPIAPTSIRSPWSAPPLPAEEEKDAIPDTDGGDFSASGAEASHSQASQGTAPSAAGNHDTTPLTKPHKSKPLPLAIPLPESLSPTAIVAITLMIAVPLSMFAGALVASIAFWLVSP
jgi:serine/threonine protein kinase